MAIPLLVVTGPTASGKTALAVSLAKKFAGEVVSADSMQVYRQMEIATAKPTKEEMSGVKHHLIDFVEPDDACFSVAQYTRLAHKTIAEIHERGHLPILAGGTGLYINAVVDNIDYTLMHCNLEIKNELALEAQQDGSEAMLERLREVDPKLASTLHQNNLGRILRALEVYKTTGIPLSEHQRRSRMTPAIYDTFMIGITYTDRASLYERVNRRVDDMLERGLLEEAMKISSFYGGTARQAIGYKELQPFIDGLASLDECVERLKQATRNYAKRQLSWFRRDERIQWISADTFDMKEDLYAYAEKLVHKSLII